MRKKFPSAICVVLLALLFVAPAKASGVDPALKPLADALAHVRAVKPDNKERDAGPELTAVKNALREWVETQLVSLRPFVPAGQGAFVSTQDAGTLAAKLNSVLQANGLTCDGPSNKQRCASDIGDFGSRGYLGGIDLSYLEYNRYLLLETNVGIKCGDDQSAYIYERTGKGWRLLLASEQDDYREDRYQPQNFLSVEVSPANVAWNEPIKMPPLILTLGYSPSCASNWQRLYARLWRTARTSVTPKPLLDLAPTLFMGDDPAIAAASLTDHDVLIEFAGNSIDGDRLVRQHVVHYEVGRHDELKRIAPVALNPVDFFDEWLTTPWKEASIWTATSALLANYHLKHHADFILGEFTGDATRCTKDMTLWQVGFAVGDEKGNEGAPSYFLVQWLAPYRFKLIDIRAAPFVDCEIVDKMPDAFGTLFPLQDWRN